MRPSMRLLSLAVVLHLGVGATPGMAQEAIPPKRETFKEKDETYYRIVQEMEEKAEENRNAYKRVVSPLSETITPLVTYSILLIVVAVIAVTIVLWVYLDAKRSVNDPSKLIAKDEWLQKKMREHQARQRPPTERF